MRKTLGEGPKWAVGTEARGKEMAVGSPGPGQYDVKKSQDGPGWVMGTGKRSEMKGSLGLAATSRKE